MRKLFLAERLLVESLLKKSGLDSIGIDFREVQVEAMSDGGMGSLKFLSSTPDELRSLGLQVEAMAKDEADGVELSISLNFDSDGVLYELDIWKVDFSPLGGYPRVDSLSSVKVIP
ncbi:hypothetical protein GCM10011297_18020 [Bacterioplanes sanyensis]|uniref:DUF6984 family protein n=1 Tax=Bacterioplanes sanyensis TaxID=1249553 RepID=UPI0019BDF3C8|nr:hypothetical protein [Bacterioplanes sanyensis]GGY45679.1 hypothetical protein GCM10011297_18020 [Bacterioplanes sanyensis]